MAIDILPARLKREQKTFLAMQQIYCRANHQHEQQGASGELCPKCRELYEYALTRLEKCPFQEQKPACAKCPIHCYRKDMRSHVREMMRFAGPRMLLRHPVLALLHITDGFRKVPALSR